MTIRAVPIPGGGHDIVTDDYTGPASGPDPWPLVLVRVRPVGTLEWGDLPLFVTKWVPDLIEALTMAREIADRQKIPAPPPPAKWASCQHHRIDNNSARCTVCDEHMLAWTTKAKTVFSAPNLAPCNNPEHLAAIAAGEPVDCDAVYLPGPAQPVLVGYEVEYQCERCSRSDSLIEGEVFIPDCGRSHRGDLIRIRESGR